MEIIIYFINFAYHQRLRNLKLYTMKKILLALFSLLLLSGVDANAQVYKFKTTDFAYRTCEDGMWSDWSDWTDSSILVVINLDREQIDIYSSEPQEFTIYDSDDVHEDRDGGSQMELKCVDGEGLRCTVRLRVQSDGVMQLYVDYSDVSYVYCLEER